MTTPPGPAQPGDSDIELKAFISELVRQTQLSFDPATIRKAIVVSSETTASPPTCTVQFPNSDGSVGTSIPGVRYLDSYTPVAGDTALLVRQGSDLFALGQINNSTQGGSAQGWQTQGGVQYRKVVDNGDFKIQFKGSFTTAGSATLWTLPTEYRPTAERNMIAARSGNTTAVQVRVSTAGVVSLVGATNTITTASTTPADTGSTTPGVTGSGGGGTTDAGGVVETSSGAAHSHTVNSTHTHSHGGQVSTTSFSATESSVDGAHWHWGGSHTHGLTAHTHTSAAHTHTSAAHTHSYTETLPATVYFDSLSYFI